MKELHEPQHEKTNNCKSETQGADQLRGHEAGLCQTWLETQIAGFLNQGSYVVLKVSSVVHRFQSQNI